ncbi:hypothetical protein HGA34_01345 [Candidatus Falkowbacteria bacterium]|nr:hypothetical protein [Candidatus Falkowbacteria bacterium]
MRKTFFAFLAASLLGSGLYALSPFAEGAHYAGVRSGYIVIQVEQHGEAWYVFPTNGQRYYLGRPADAFKAMRSLALGVPHGLIANTSVFPERFSGMILLDVESHGEAYYIYPKNRQKYYLGRPDDAFRVMRELGQGITDAELKYIPEGELDKPIILPTGKTTNIKVPFTSQAPFGGWSDQRQQDGCEESSSLMAVRWATGKALTKDEALKEILGSSDYTLKKYGEYRDISAADTVSWILNDYFKYTKVGLKKNITVDDIVAELDRGNVVLTPMDGQMLHNPNFTSPGPPRHMLVIRGYDPERKVFITNDPGTRNGEGYEYSAKVLFESIRDYPTGYHEPISKIEKNMIVVWK